MVEWNRKQCAGLLKGDTVWKEAHKERKIMEDVPGRDIAQGRSRRVPVLKNRQQWDPS